MNDNKDPYPVTSLAFRRMGKILAQLRYVPESEMIKLEELYQYRNDTATELLINALASVIHDMAPAYDSLVSQHGGVHIDMYRKLYKRAIDALEAKRQYDERKSV